MAPVRVQLSRFFSEFWWRGRDGLYGRFVESWAYPVALDLVAMGGFVCVLAVLGYAAFDRSLAALGGSVLVLAPYLLALALLTSYGASASHSVRHDGPPGDVLAQCRNLLARHDFQFRAETSASIRASRGAGAGAESTWGRFPLEISVTAAPTGKSSLLSVRCTGESGRYRFVRGLIAKTAQAIANLDGASLKTLDKTLVRRPGALFQGGLGTIVLAAMLGCAALSTVALVGASYLLATYVLDVTQASAAADELQRIQVQLTSGMDAALRAEAERLASKLGKAGSKGAAPGETVRSLAPFSVPGEFVAGVAEPQGKVTLFHPASVEWTQGGLIGGRRYGLARLGNAVVRELPQPQARELEAELGLKPGQLIFGAALTLADLARFAPGRMGSDSLEITFFDSSRPFLRYVWRPGKRVQIDAGSHVLPADVLAGAARRLEADWTVVLRDVLFGGDIGGVAIRKEMRDGAPHLVSYNVTRKEGGNDAWDGVSVARSYEPSFETREWILPLAVALGLMALLPVLIVTVALASIISNRISRPALQVRDALRAIGEGDYSVRLQPARGDEIGQMQAQLNETAEGLEKREQQP